MPVVTRAPAYDASARTLRRRNAGVAADRPGCVARRCHCRGAALARIRQSVRHGPHVGVHRAVARSAGAGALRSAPAGADRTLRSRRNSAGRMLFQQRAGVRCPRDRNRATRRATRLASGGSDQERRADRARAVSPCAATAPPRLGARSRHRIRARDLRSDEHPLAEHAVHRIRGAARRLRCGRPDDRRRCARATVGTATTRQRSARLPSAFCSWACRASNTCCCPLCLLCRRSSRFCPARNAPPSRSLCWSARSP